VDGLTLVCSLKAPDRDRDTDIWVCTRSSRNESFSSPEHLGPIVNSRADEAGPSLADDGLTLLFASERPGGYGGSDIWMSTRASPNAPWGHPVNLGPMVNTSESDGGPDLSADGLALVFESRRTVSHGLGDLWISTRSSVDRPWGEPVNLGAEVNSPTWDAEPSFAVNDTFLFYQTRGRQHDDGGQEDNDIWVVPIRRPEE